MKKLPTLTLLFLSLLFPLGVTAQEELRSITLSPPIVEITLSPGTFSEGVIKISNNSNEALTFSLETEDLSYKTQKELQSFSLQKR